MATAVVNIAEAAKQPNDLSEGNAFDIVYSSSSQQNFEGSISINKMNNPSSTDDTTAQSQSQNSTTKDSSSCFQSTDGSQENKENDFTDEAPKNVAKRKYRNVLDSDSEKEDDFISSLLKESNAEEASGPLESEMKKSDVAELGKRSRRVIDSEPEGEDSVIAVRNVNYDKDSGNEDECSGEPATKETVKWRFRTLVDSESEEDSESKPSKKSQEENDEKASSNESTTTKVNKKQKISSIVDSTSDDKDDSENTTTRSLAVKNKKKVSDRNKKAKADKKIVKSKISSLIDTDSEDDGTHNNVDRTPRDEQHKSGNLAKKTEKSAKKRTGSIRASKVEAMRQIHSETQRLIRSTEVSLPYHRPKQRSLQEFLNRKQFIPALPEGLTTAAKVKMSSEIVGKVLEEKEKEAELFYKSSDSEDEVAIGSTSGNPEGENEGSSSSTLVDHLNIEDTQKIFKNDVQNAHNKKEIIQQGAVDLGIPRKLFANDMEDLTENKPTETEYNNEEVSNCEDPRKKTKETKLGLREVSVPRKLFGSDYDEAVAPSNSQDALAAASQPSEIVESNSESAESSRREDAFRSFIESDGGGMKPTLQDALSDKNARDLDTTAWNTIADENAEFSNISDTPFISNKEFAKLNEQGKASRQRVDSSEKLDEDDDSKEPEAPIGHVFGLQPPDFDSDDLRAEKLSDTKKKLPLTASSGGPRLRGTPGTFIDLSDDVKPNREGVGSLVDRFMRHSATNKPAEVSSSVTVLHTEKTADGLKIVEQILPYKILTADNFNDKVLNKPGAKYFRLKNELIEKMAKKRGEEWKLKEQQEKNEHPEEGEEIEDEFDEEAEEEPLDDEFQVSGESEPEEDDMPPEKNKKRKPRDFADEEAEVSGEEDDLDDEEMEDSDENVDNEEEGDKEGNRREVIDEYDDTCDILSGAENETANERKKSNRTVKAFEDDSNSLPENSLPSEIDSREKVFERTKTDVDMFAPEDGNDGWLSDTEAEIPPSQVPPREQSDTRSQLCKTPLTAVNILRFVSPITQLTAFNSCTESPKDGFASKGTPGPNLRFVESSTEKTPIEKKSPISLNSEKRNGFQKKLFDDPAGTVNDEELMDICSGKFTGMENDDEGTETHGKVSESQLLGLCSDSFSLQALNSENIEKITPVPVVDEASQDIRLTFDGNSEDSCDKLIGKESITKSKAPWATFKVASSSDEENSRENQSEGKDRRKKLKKKQVKKLELSDDEYEESLASEEEEESHILDNDNEDKYVDYDSEENEVVIVPKKDITKVAAGFLDEEAELSESEWGSADEDEKDLDKLEFEEGDEEEIDENQMRDQLGKMHMRQVLDDDRREVRMLQELLLDDGDLHTEGGGRERQFKWKNIDNLDDDDKLGPRNDDLDENGVAIEEDNDLEWRKQRLEREKFIEDEMKSSIDIVNDELEGDSQIFKLGMIALMKSKNTHSSQKEPDAAVPKKPLVPRTILDLLGCPTTEQNSKILKKAVKRGSFLARGDECLARLAVQIKHSETTITTRKNPRNFVFTHISPAVADTVDKEQKDETTTNGDSPADIKAKKRKPPAGVTPRAAKKAKIEVTRSTGKKLF